MIKSLTERIHEDLLFTRIIYKARLTSKLRKDSYFISMPDILAKFCEVGNK